MTTSNTLNASVMLSNDLNASLTSVVSMVGSVSLPSIVNDHSLLINRNQADQHTIASITGLESRLNSLESTASEINETCLSTEDQISDDDISILFNT